MVIDIKQKDTYVSLSYMIHGSTLCVEISSGSIHCFISILDTGCSINNLISAN